jgi:hypothetical protein
MSRRVSVSIRRLMLPFVPDAEERSTTATFAVPRLSDDEEWFFGMTANMIYCIHNVNTRVHAPSCGAARQNRGQHVD